MTSKACSLAVITFFLAVFGSTEAQVGSPDRAASSVSPKAESPVSAPALWATESSNQVRLITPVTARTAPPHGPLNLFVGDRLFELQQGDVVDVVGRKSYGGFTGAQIWLEVAKRSADGTASRTRAWIPAGTLVKDSVLPDRVELVKQVAPKAEK